MIISELQARLEFLKKTHGDLPIKGWAKLDTSHLLCPVEEENVNVRHRHEGLEVIISMSSK